MSKTKYDGYRFVQDPTATDVHVKYAMAYISRMLAENISIVKSPKSLSDITDNKKREKIQQIKQPTPTDPLCITSNSTDENTWKEAQFLWTALMVFGEKHNFDNKSIVTNWEKRISSEVGVSSRYAESSLYETQFKHHLKPYMLEISKTAALFENISGFYSFDQQHQIHHKRQFKEIGLSKEEIRQKREEEKKEFILMEETCKKNAILADQKEIRRRKEHKEKYAALREEWKLERETLEKKRKIELNNKEKSLRETTEQVKYYMAIASRKLAKRSKPTPDKPIFITGNTGNEIKCQWTAFMLFGEKLGFNDSSIITDVNIVCLKSQKGFISKFSNESLYETKFKHHLKPHMLEISQTAALYDDIPGFFSEAEQVELNRKRELDEIGLSEQEIQDKRKKQYNDKSYRDELWRRQREYVETLEKQNQDTEADDNDEYKFFRKQAAGVKEDMAIASRILADLTEPVAYFDKLAWILLQDNHSGQLRMWTAYMLFREKLGYDDNSLQLLPDEHIFKRLIIKNKICSFSQFSKNSYYETQFKHHIKPYMLEISKNAALYDDISGFLSEKEQTQLNKKREFDEMRLSEEEIEQKREHERSPMAETVQLESGCGKMEQKKQRRVLINAVNKYLMWLEKGVDNDREHKVTYSMWLQYLTAFEKNRAITLRTSLMSYSAANTVGLLQNHFKKDSTINDYSLDTYLLESIFTNKYLFLISEKFTDINTFELRIKLQNLILSQPLYTDAEYPFMLGQLYEADIDTEGYLKNACKYYTIAMQDNHDAYTALHILAKKGTSEAQYYLGAQFYNNIHNVEKAIYWCLQAAEQKHSLATQYIFDTNFSLEHYQSIGDAYIDGCLVQKNIDYAIQFYEKACALNSINVSAGRYPQDIINSSTESKNLKYTIPSYIEKNILKYVHYSNSNFASTLLVCFEAIDLDDKSAETFLEKYVFPDEYILQIANYYKGKSNSEKAFSFYHKASSLKSANFELGLMYEQGRFVKKDLEKAFQHFYIATEKGHSLSLEKMNTIAYQLNIPSLWLTFANTCLLLLEDPYPGLAILKNLAETHYKPAEDGLAKIVFSNYKHAFVLGQLYEQENKPETRIEKAYFYYLLALESLDRELFGEKKIQEKLHTLFLDKTISAEDWLWIANLYALPHQGFLQNWTKAKYFLEIAAHKGSVVALYQLGQLYEYGHGVKKNLIRSLEYYEQSKNHPESVLKLKTAFELFQVAAEKGHKQALEKINYIANQLNTPELWLSLANTYLMALEDPYRALVILKNITELSQPAENLLTQLTFSNHEHAFILGQLYEQDNVPETLVKKAYFYYLLALESPDIKLENAEIIQEKLRMLSLGNAFSADDWLWLASLYVLPHEGFNKDWIKAKKYIEIAANQESIIALYQLGQLYEYGHGVEKNLVIALQYYEQSKTNPDSAIKWDQIIESPCTPNSVLAKLLQICETGDDVFEKDDVRAIALHTILSSRGFTEASMHLGQFFQIKHYEFLPKKHDLFSKDEHRAFGFYLDAAKGGDRRALIPLERLAESQGAQEQRELGIIFLKIFNDEAKHDYWNDQADLLENCPFNF